MEVTCTPMTDAGNAIHGVILLAAVRTGDKGGRLKPPESVEKVAVENEAKGDEVKPR